MSADKDLISVQQARDLVEAAHRAQGEVVQFDQAKIDRICDAMAKAAFELLQPPDEALNPRGRRAIDHCAAPYQMMTKSTMSSIQITGETRTHLTI